MLSLEQLRRRVGELNAEEKTDFEIAAILTAEGFRTTRGEEINKIAVCYLRKLWGIRANRAYEGGHNRQRWDDGTYSIQGVMAAIGVHKSTVYFWLQQGLLDAKQSAKGTPWKVALSEEQILRLGEYAQQRRPARQREERAVPSVELVEILICHDESKFAAR
ncbi:MAG: hypothetical protein L0226_08965 [Acidobacteria bacterium]|nr:hypothetical protein [Acidobacteriota bacterium]